MTGVMLRKATREDAATIGVLHVASWRETYAGLIPDEMLAGLSIDARTEMWGKILGGPDECGCTAVFIAEDSGRAIGFGCCGQQRDDALTGMGFSGEFRALYVRRSHQGRGVGRSIMSAMSRELSAAGHSAAGLWVLRQNLSARVFYDKLGGEIVGEKIDEKPGAILVEDAYGWRNLSCLSS